MILSFCASQRHFKPQNPYKCSTGFGTSKVLPQTPEQSLCKRPDIFHSLPDKNSDAVLDLVTRHIICFFCSLWNWYHKMFLDLQEQFRISQSGLSYLELGKSSTITSTEVSGSFDPDITVKYQVFTVTGLLHGVSWVIEPENILNQACANVFESLEYTIVSKHLCAIKSSVYAEI